MLMFIGKTQHFSNYRASLPPQNMHCTRVSGYSEHGTTVQWKFVCTYRGCTNSATQFEEKNPKKHAMQTMRLSQTALFSDFSSLCRYSIIY